MSTSSRASRLGALGAVLVVTAFSTTGCTGGAPARLPDGQAGTNREPSAVVAGAASLVKAGRYQEALREYLWAFDHGVEVLRPFFAARATTVVHAIAKLGSVYPPARAALVERQVGLRAAMLRAATGRGAQPEVVEPDLHVEVALFAEVNITLCDGASTRETYDVIKQSVPPSAPLRRYLWMEIFHRLLAAKRYAEAAQEGEVSMSVLNFGIRIVDRVRSDPELEKATELMRDSIREAGEETVDRGGDYFEALVGARQQAAADAVAEKVIAFEGTGRTFAVLIRHALRAGDTDVATRLHQRARQVVPAKDRALVDEAAGAIPGSR